MLDLKQQKLIFVEVLIPTMVDEIILWLFLLNEMFLLTNYFLRKFSISCTSYQRNAVKGQLLKIALKQNSYAFFYSLAIGR